MGRKSKYSADFKLMIIHEAETLGITRTSRKYSISDHTIRTWKLIYKYQGIQGLEPTHSNNTYSREYKASLVEEYQKKITELEAQKRSAQVDMNSIRDFVISTNFSGSIESVSGFIHPVQGGSKSAGTWAYPQRIFREHRPPWFP